MKIEVDGTGYDNAADVLLGANEIVASAYTSLTSALSGYGAMGGDDTSSEEFVAGYDSSARGVVVAISDLAVAFGTMATLTESSGANHRDADAGSIYRGRGAGGGQERDSIAPREVAAITPPSALGGDASDTPEFWDLIVDHLQGWAWPSADTDRLRQAAGTWETVGAALDRVPSSCEVARTHLSAQRSPEIAMATRAVSEVEQAATDLAAECRNIATSCTEYAEKVDGTKDLVRGLLKDLAIEIGATAVVSGLASLVTFGGAAAVGASVALARAVSYARRVVVALQGIRAIRAIGIMIRTVDKATDVTRLLRKFRSARNLRRRPPGRLPETGRPKSYGYDRDGQRLPYANSRPGYGPNQVDDVFRRAMDEDGKVFVLDKNGIPVEIDWRPGMPRTGVWDMGHVPNSEYRTLRDQYLSGEITHKQFLDEFRDPSNYRPEHPGRNRSGVDEAIRRYG